jgi:hypothetical protein
MNKGDDQARAIAERVARRLAANQPASQSRAEPTTSNGTESAPERPRARIIDFVSAGPPLRSGSATIQSSAVEKNSEPLRSESPSEYFQFVPVTQSPWLGRLPAMLSGNNPPAEFRSTQPASHSSEERFGIEEATVAELVEFFENEKKCSMDPSGKPCDHCAMCSSRGF